jgi:hypothetical protein
MANTDSKTIHLLNSGKPAHKFTRAEQVMGGKVRSPAKTHANRIKGFMSKQLTETQAHFLALIQSGKIDELVKALLGDLLSERLDLKQKTEILRIICGLLPSKNINLNIGKETQYTFVIDSGLYSSKDIANAKLCGHEQAEAHEQEAESTDAKEINNSEAAPDGDDDGKVYL